MFHVGTSPLSQDLLAPKPSPLAPRDPNSCPRFSLRMAAMRTAGNKDNEYSHQRAYNPLLRRRAGEERDHKRQVFLKKVKKDGDDRIWESRSEQILRQDFIAKQRQWEFEQARTAPEAPSSPGEEEQDDETPLSQELESVDQLLSQDDQNIEDLVLSMQHAERDGEDDDQCLTRNDYGSDEDECDEDECDEDEYDLLFREVLSKDEAVNSCVKCIHSYKEEVTPGGNHDHEMDISVG